MLTEHCFKGITRNHLEQRNMRWITTLQLVVCFYLPIVVIREGCCCEHGWLQYGEHCIRIYIESLSRWAARRQCLMEGSDLISIHESELRYLPSVLGRLRRYRFWVGLPYNHPDAKASLHDSASGQEERWSKSLNEREILSLMAAPVDCFAFHEGKVEKYPCSKWLGYICEYKRSNTTIRTCNWRENKEISFIGKAEGDCLFTPSEKTTKNEVEELCARYQGHFINLYDIMKEGSFAFDGSKYWTDLTWNETNLLWSDSLDEDLGDLFVNDTGSCITIQFIYTNVIKTSLHQTECDSKAKVVCSVNKDVDDDAAEAISEDTIGNFTEDTIGNFTEDSIGNFTEDTTGNFTDDTTEEFSKGTDEDINGNSTENTTEVITEDVTATEMPLNDTFMFSCPQGWKSDKRGRNCYWATWIVNERLPWEEAEEYCQRFGGNLASFHSSSEEEIGLSFQYGSYALYPYWIGLKLDPENETYRWSDGTPLDYTNWAPGQPDHKDQRLRCVAMTQKVFSNISDWMSTHCGFPGLFICKAPAQASELSPVLPTPTPIPLQPCRSVSKVGPGIKSYFFKESCYFTVSENYNWYKAKQFCENVLATLVSIHSVEEVGFLLKLLYESDMGSTHVWIGLNALGSDESLRWTDWSNVDFSYFNNDQPNNFQIQKCYSIFDTNALWNQENCNAVLGGFMCKRRNDTSLNPTKGNCKKGWIPYRDRCYFLGGRQKKSLVNWTQALDVCRNKGGYLTSIRNEKDQGFLSYLLQILGQNAWIGLHNTTETGSWVDNSYFYYTNWIKKEPTPLVETEEDCIMMVYDFPNAGKWKANKCDQKMGYICYSRKDTSLPKPPIDLEINCPQPKGWLRLHNMCFKMFSENNLTWQDAETACQKYNAHLVSLSDARVNAVLSHLTSEVKKPFWIGLQYKESDENFNWLNGWAVTMAKWDKGEPSLIPVKDNVCVASTSEGYWKKFKCTEKMPYVCQITTRNLVFKETIRTYFKITSSKMTPYAHVAIIVGTTCMFVVLLIVIAAVYFNKSVVRQWFVCHSCHLRVSAIVELALQSMNSAKKEVQVPDQDKSTP